MRKAHLLLSLLLCGLLAAGIGVRGPVAGAQRPSDGKGPGLNAHQLQLPQHEGELNVTQLLVRNAHQVQREPIHPHQLPLPAVSTRTACRHVPLSAQNDKGARAYLRHLHPTHDFP